MKLIRMDDAFVLDAPTALCLGTFDGVHPGHAALLKTAVRIAREQSLIPAVFTFDQPPAVFFHPEAEPFLLTSVEEKAALMAEYGIEAVICCPFSLRFGGMDKQDFFDRILIGKCRAEAIVVGFHYTFGKGAEGNARTLREMCARRGILLEVLPPQYNSEGELYASSTIRTYLTQGQREKAEQMLGRPLSERQIQLLRRYPQ